MENNALSFFASIWKGPALTIRVKNTSKTIGQGDPKTTITFADTSIFKRALTNPSIVFGEAYMDGSMTIDGDIQDVLKGYYATSEALEKASAVRLAKTIQRIMPRRIPVDAAIQNARHHYDIGNDFYKLWLDKSMAYTCAYYANENDDLETAQRQKFELVCRKARLQPGQSVIDLGCGWGGLIFHAVERYGVTATGVVAAKEQGAYIQEEARRRGVSDKITIQVSDWRHATGTYDRVLSVGMLEHVGKYHYDEFFPLVKSMLARDGIAFVHSIGRMRGASRPDPWISKYIFPGHYVPTPAEMVSHAAEAGLHVTDLENLWQHYTKTLTHWAENYARHRSEVIKMYDEEFDRMWWLYLQGSIGAFRWGGLNLWQVVLTNGKHVAWPLQREVHVGEDSKPN